MKNLKANIAEFKTLLPINTKSLDKVEKDLYDLIDEASENFTNWQAFEEIAPQTEIDESLDLFLQLYRRNNVQQKDKNKSKAEPKLKAQPKAKSEAQPRPKVQSKATEEQNENPYFKEVTHKSAESAHFRRIVSLVKNSTKEKILQAFRALQKAITSRVIRKNSPFAKEIEQIQSIYLKILNAGKAPYQVKLSDEDYAKFVLLAGGEKVYDSVRVLNTAFRFLDEDGTVRIGQDKAKSLLKTFKNVQIKAEQPYASEAKEFLNYLHNQADKPSQAGYNLKPSLSGLHGFQGLGCACSPTPLTGLGKLPDTMSAPAVMDLKYQTYNFTGDYLELIGKPQLNFSLMVWGQPGQGKSTFSIAFGNYLAQHFGKVAYLSSEEYGSYTLQDKLKRVGQISPKLFFIKNLQEFKPTYDFLLIDSVNNFGLGLEEYRALRAKYPNIGIVLIMQATKGGQFRGEKAWEHDVDTVIKLEAGKAFTTKNRFKELSQITVF